MYSLAIMLQRSLHSFFNITALQSLLNWFCVGLLLASLMRPSQKSGITAEKEQVWALADLMALKEEHTENSFYKASKATVHIVEMVLLMLSFHIM